MSYRNKTYVAFDGDTDIHYYRLMMAWKTNDHHDFNFHNAHDLNSARDTSDTESIKAQLRERMANSKQLILLVGEKTKYLRRFVPWEIDLARKKDIPIIVVNLNGDRGYDDDLCPEAVKTWDYTINIPFNQKIMQYALDNFPDRYHTNKNLTDYMSHKYHYKDSVYEELGL